MPYLLTYLQVTWDVLKGAYEQAGDAASTALSCFMAFFYAYVGILGSLRLSPHLVGSVSGAGILLLFGVVGTFTKLHLDQFGALCIAFAVADVMNITGAGNRPKGEKCVVALWLCVHPSQEAIAHVKEKIAGDAGLKKSLSHLFQPAPVVDHKGRCILGGENMTQKPISAITLRALAAACDKRYVVLIEQEHCMWVRVHPGWMHYVLNVQDNVKATVEVLDIKRDLLNGSWYMHTIGSKYFGVQNPEDYTNFLVNAEARVRSSISKYLNGQLHKRASGSTSRQ